MIGRGSHSSKQLLAGVACVAVLGLGASTATADPVQDYIEQEAVRALVEMGHIYYAMNCASCHGMTARGGGPAASALKVPPPDLTRIAARRNGKFDIDELSQFVDGRFSPGAHGSREMPIWGSEFSRSVGGGSTGDEITRGRILALLEYLRTLQRN
jgi:mono/diheme cytochrome c family protein